MLGHKNNNNGTPNKINSRRTYAECAAGAAKAVGLVRYLESAVAAAERAYAERAGGLVRLRAAVALRERHGTAVGSTREQARVEEARFEETRHGEAHFGETRVGAAFAACEEAGGRVAGAGGRGGRSAVAAGRQEEAADVGAAGCGDCSALFEANERLIQEARHRGLLG